MKVEHYSASAESDIHPEVANISNGIVWVWILDSGCCTSQVPPLQLPETSGLGNLTTDFGSIRTTETIDGDGMVFIRTIDISSHWKRTVVTSKKNYHRLLILAIPSVI